MFDNTDLTKSLSLRHYTHMKSLSLSLFFVILFSSILCAAPLNRTPSSGKYKKPQETAEMMKLPDGFQVKVFAWEPDVIQPIAFTID